MRYIFFTLLTIAFNSSNAQGFYDEDKIQTIEITFAQSNWDQLLDIAYASEAGYILAENVTINGVEFDSVGVKYKGNSTYSSNQTKNPFHIELDTYKDHEYQGYKDIKLSNIDKDPSFLREPLSYHILRKYMVAPQSNYANVYVNGDLIGLYTNSESITKTFTNKYFGSKGNTFIKCNPPDGAGPQSNDFPNLVYLGEDSTDYYDAYEMKTDFGWSDLIDLCDTLDNNLEHISDILDVDKTLWMLAYNNALVNLDSYIGGFSQNYYLYRDDYGRFLPVVWDLNESFGRFAMTGSGNLNNTTSKQQMSHLLHSNDSDFPLIKQLLSDPTYKKMYLAHYKTILLENFDNGAYYEVALGYKNLIDEAVLNDDNKLFSYNNFQNNLDNDVNAGGGPGPMGGSVPGIANLMDGRTNYLLGLSDFNQTEPTIANINLMPEDPIIDENVILTAELLETSSALFGYRTETHAPFTWLQMFDDGMHGDGDFGDGIYGVEFNVESAFVQYYIFAENATAGKFSPVRAEHEYHTFTATSTNTDAGDLVINEFMASNDNAVADQDGEFDDWIELYNNGIIDYDLEGYTLSDDLSDLKKWKFPDDSSIDADAYLVIWADDDIDQDGLHASFKLSAAAETIFLVDPNGEIIDEVSYVNQKTDISFGRFPNGTGDFYEMEHTIGAENDILNSISENQLEIDLKVYPNPAKEYITLVYDDSEINEVRVYNIYGQSIYNGSISNELIIHTIDWEPGIYFIKCQQSTRKVLILK